MKNEENLKISFQCCNDLNDISFQIVINEANVSEICKLLVNIISELNSKFSRFQTIMSRSDLTCDVSSSSVSAGQSLPSKIYDCQSKVVLIQDLLQAGVAEIQGGDGRLVYCFFQVITTSNPTG